ncbi:eCIS core domain-containing protein [Aquimarina latercula]|uniref:eCIS core domain-containing protein n=1 Tax=Aquimarina latercula TaxID=987 RepID=UPI0003FBC254|nr:DUF4157 domain-containing protein [Aquimarina latercula]
MKTQTDKTQEPQHSITPRVASESSNGGTAQLKDNRTSSLSQRKLRSGMDSMDNSNNPIQRKNKTGLPDNLKSGIENLSGYSMDDVKVHYNSSKPAQLQAHAYAQGTDIHLAPGQEKHLPHEAWHLVQQKQGRVKPTKQLKSKVNINDDAGLEREADVMGNRANSNRWLPSKQYVSSSKISQSSTQAIQRFKADERPYENAYAKILNSSQWFPTAKAYEQRLGAYCSSHPLSINALNAGMDKLISIMERRYQDEWNENEEDLLKEVFFRDDKTSTGQVGLNLNTKKMYAVLREGNLRERMTAFYNAAYYGSGYGDEIKRGFKKILHEIIFDNQTDLIDELELKEDAIQEQVAYYNNYLNRGVMRPLIKLGTKVSTKLLNGYRGMRGQNLEEDSSYTFGKDVFALGNLSIQANDSSVRESQKNRTNRPRPVNREFVNTPQDFEEMGVPLSNEELAFSYEDDNLNLKGRKKRSKKARNKARRNQTRQEALPWVSGNAMFEISPDDSWYKKIHDQLRMPVVAGVSGTTTRMLKAYQFLNVPNSDLDFRLALMGWMLPVWDHSLYEILRGSHIAGVKGENEDKNIKDVVRMYMNVAPLRTEELRHNVANDKMFPHEELYTSMATAHLPPIPYNSPLNPLVNPNTEHLIAPTANVANLTLENLRNAQENDTDGTYTNVSKAHAIAIGGYSSSLHSLLNTTIRINDSFYKAVKESLWNLQPDIGADRVSKNTIRAKFMEQVRQRLNRETEGVEGLEVLGPIRNRLINLRDVPAAMPFTINDINDWIAELVDEIYPELKLHVNMAMEGLNNIPPSDDTVFTGQTYVKGWNSIKSGKTVLVDEFMSTSKNMGKAVGFAVRNSENDWYKNPILIEIKLNSKGGRDISGISVHPEEEEVLLLPGTKIRIDSEKMQDFTSTEDEGIIKIKVVKAVEV